jgi:hypothetical protein
MPLGGEQGVHRSGGRVQVVVEQAGQRRPPLLFAVLVGGKLTGVGAQQVMHAVPARPAGLDQVRAGQLVKHVAGPLKGGAGERGRRIAVKIGAGMQAQQPEPAGGAGVQGQVRPGKHGPHGGARVPAGGQQVQPPLLISQFTDQVGERGGGPGHGELGPSGKRSATWCAQ